MPKLTKEVSSGAQFSRSSQEGVVADSQTRVFKILLEQPGEVVNLQSECGIFIGDQHPYNTNIYCQSFSAAFDGDSRMVLVCTFQYGTTPSSGGGDGGGSGDSKSQPPDIRPANWSVSSVTYEQPAYLWKAITGPDVNNGWVVPANQCGDRYDGVVKLEPVVTIVVEQYHPYDPTRDVKDVGKVNSNTMRIGSLEVEPRQLLLKGVQSQPVVESWGELVYRGWKVSYEFAFRANYAGDVLGNIGWDVAIPHTGFSVRAFAPPGNANQDPYGQPLRHDGYMIADPPALPDNVAAGEKVRAMIKVFEYENGGASQAPCAQPVPLNDDGTPRSADADPKVLVYRYQVQDEMDFTILGLRLT